jgi:hypothetical protein
MTLAAESPNALNARDMDISAQYVQIQRNTAIAAAIITHRNAQAYYLRHASGAQSAMEKSMNYGQRSAQKG